MTSLAKECTCFLMALSQDRKLGQVQRPDLTLLSDEMKKQGAQNDPNIFEDVAIITFRNFPQLFNLENQLRIINKFWFRT